MLRKQNYNCNCPINWSTAFDINLGFDQKIQKLLYMKKITVFIVYDNNYISFLNNKLKYISKLYF